MNAWQIHSTHDTEQTKHQKTYKITHTHTHKNNIMYRKHTRHTKPEHFRAISIIISCDRRMFGEEVKGQSPILTNTTRLFTAHLLSLQHLKKQTHSSQITGCSVRWLIR